MAYERLLNLIPSNYQSLYSRHHLLLIVLVLTQHVDTGQHINLLLQYSEYQPLPSNKESNTSIKCLSWARFACSSLENDLRIKLLTETLIYR